METYDVIMSPDAGEFCALQSPEVRCRREKGRPQIGDGVKIVIGNRLQMD